MGEEAGDGVALARRVRQAAGLAEEPGVTLDRGFRDAHGAGDLGLGQAGAEVLEDSVLAELQVRREGLGVPPQEGAVAVDGVLLEDFVDLLIQRVVGEAQVSIGL